jgi:hypothetical protein
LTKKKKASSTKVIKKSNSSPLEQLVAMFSDISHIEKAKNDIAVYIKVNKNIINQILKTFSFDRIERRNLNYRFSSVRILQLGIKNQE